MEARLLPLVSYAEKMVLKALTYAFLFVTPSLALAQVPRPEYKKIITIAGSGKTGDVIERSSAAESRLSNPFGVQPEADGSLVIASWDQHVIYRLDASYRSVEVIAGTGKAGSKGRDGDYPLQIELNQPHEIQVSPAGDIYVADTSNHRVGVIERSTGRWSVVAGTGQAGFSGDQGPAVRAEFDQAYSIALRGDELFIADLGNHRIRRVDLHSGKLNTICGTGEKALPQNGSLAINQPLSGPRSLAVDDENLWIVLREGNSVWRIGRSDGRIYHVAGTGEKGFTGDGADARLATFRGPKGIAVDPGKAVYIADTENHAIRRVDLSSGLIATVVGSADESPGFNGDGDELHRRTLKRPHGVCLLPNGALLVGDSENHRLRMLVK